MKTIFKQLTKNIYIKMRFNNKYQKLVQSFYWRETDSNFSKTNHNVLDYIQWNNSARVASLQKLFLCYVMLLFTYTYFSGNSNMNTFIVVTFIWAINSIKKLQYVYISIFWNWNISTKSFLLSNYREISCYLISVALFSPPNPSNQRGDHSRHRSGNLRRQVV